MDYKSIIDNIVWLIPFKKLRNNVRLLLLKTINSNNEIANCNNELNIIKHKLDLIYSNTTLLSMHLGIDICNKAHPLYINDNYKTHYFVAQDMQDYIAYQYLKSIKNDFFSNGFYIDIGAHDGISGSTTLIFEKLGWKGICVEANPINYEQLLKNRKNSLCINAAVSNQNMPKAQFVDIEIHNFLSFLNLGISDEEYNNRLVNAKKYLESLGILKENDELKLNFIDVEVINFDEIMKKFPNVKHIDFLSIDIEGGELNLLKSIDFHKFSFSMIGLEGHDNIIIDFMLENGYKVFTKTLSDTIFIPQ
ncbi:FkbM family methyltransferase [Brachyspira intermedia]|uniref:FkbM family methyltransferase n=1 Tax=Brachyspira intermedia TaxID=84377 RepID=UPI0030063164